MKIKSSVGLIAMGVGGTIMYQQIKNGNAQKMLKKITKKDMMKNLEDMI